MLLGAVFLLSGAAAAAKEKAIPIPPPPPMAVPGKVSVYRGNTVVIPLKAAGRTPGQVRFIIRTYPKSGTLGEIRLTGPTTGEVTYTHDDGPAGLDQFAFAAQAADTPVSASGKMMIAILEQPSELAISGDLEFGEVTLGEMAEREFELQNKGGGVIEGRLEVSAPWRIDGKDEFRLGRYEKKRVNLIFAPDSEKKYSGEFVFGGVVMAELGSLAGTGVAPLELPTSTELQAGAEGMGRSGALRIKNRTARERQVEFRTPEGILPISPVMLAPGAEQTIEVNTRPDFLTSMDANIALRSEAYVAEVPVRVYSAPPVLHVSMGAIHFGTIEAGREYRQSFEISNSGGSDARLSARMGGDLLVVPDPDTVVLAPGHSRKFELIVQSTRVGDFRDSVQVGAGSTKPLELAVEAQVVEPKKPVASSSSMVGVPLVPVVEARDDSINQADLSDLRAIDSARLIKRTPWRVVLSWKKPQGKVGGYLIEGRYLVPRGQGMPEIKWETWKGIRFQEEGDRVVADIRNLPPAGKWFIRMRSTDDSGKQSAPSPVFQIATTRAPVIWPWIVAVLIVVAGFFGWRIHLARQREESAAEAARISQIGK